MGQEVVMLRGKELRGRAVVDLDAAEKVGGLVEIVLDPASQRVAGLIVSQQPGGLGKGRQLVLPAPAVRAVGPDAITVRRGCEPGFELWQLSGLPRLSQLIGRKVVSYSGSLLGTIDDVLIDDTDGRILGYALGKQKPLQGLERWLAGETKSPLDYVRADADLRIGPTMIIVPDEAVVRGADRIDGAAATATPVSPAAAAPGWSDFALSLDGTDGYEPAALEAERRVPSAVGSGVTELERTASMRSYTSQDGRIA
jgi:sporulation protein YlmC with PRC-barrel domain